MGATLWLSATDALRVITELLSGCGPSIGMVLVVTAALFFLIPWTMGWYYALSTGARLVETRYGGRIARDRLRKALGEN